MTGTKRGRIITLSPNQVNDKILRARRTRLQPQCHDPCAREGATKPLGCRMAWTGAGSQGRADVLPPSYRREGSRQLRAGGRSRFSWSRSIRMASRDHGVHVDRRRRASTCLSASIGSPLGQRTGRLSLPVVAVMGKTRSVTIPSSMASPPLPCTSRSAFGLSPPRPQLSCPKCSAHPARSPPLSWTASRSASQAG